MSSVAADAPAGDATPPHARKPSLRAERRKLQGSLGMESPFTSAHARDIASSLDQAKPASIRALAETVSGPLMTTETLGALDAVGSAPFDALCNGGWAIGRDNVVGKLLRLLFTPVKELYLPAMTWGLPTNHLMVSRSGEERLGAERCWPGRGVAGASSSVAVLHARMCPLTNSPSLGLPCVPACSCTHNHS
jgi:hypothetical protein